MSAATRRASARRSSRSCPARRLGATEPLPSARGRLGPGQLCTARPPPRGAARLDRRDRPSCQRSA
eukprot:9383261-Pyramimonas_sp.AAC.1